MKAKIAEFLRTPEGIGVLIGFGLVAAWMVSLVFLPDFVPDSWPGWLQIGVCVLVGAVAGNVLMRLGARLGSEVGRYLEIKRDYDAVARDIERLERGDR